jgi:hypothetical protein
MRISASGRGIATPRWQVAQVTPAASRAVFPAAVCTVVLSACVIAIISRATSSRALPLAVTFGAAPRPEWQ